MSKLPTLSKYVPIACLCILPVWVGLGRIFFGVGGWLILATLFLLTPVLFFILAVLSVLTLTRQDVRATSKLTPAESLLWIGVIVSSILFELTLIDGGDTQESVNSVLTKVAGRGLENVSGIIAYIAVGLGMVCLVGLLVYNIYRIIHLKRAAAQPSDPVAAPSPDTTKADSVTPPTSSPTSDLQK